MADNMIAAMLRAAMPDDRPIQAQCMAQGAEEIERLSRELAESLSHEGAKDLHIAELEQRASTQEAALRGYLGLILEDGYEVNVAQLKHQLAESERLADAFNRGNRELAMENERLREALRKYGSHDGACPTYKQSHLNCTCGFDAALTAPASGGAGRTERCIHGVSHLNRCERCD